ncbi:NHLP-related RiPP peptide [Xanthomonas axonopodis pv. begoniae]|uniref:NHLP-related RiPP peptide n=1 Tax=Xanthomonas phaseoli TaxID=1985254 RepID=UPI000CEF27FB|nr:NHLP-related RiPP peptide [Xanthomonas phaseoli]MBO9738257.1 NHLP-related RiPP peptide [Xanthomonas axonopodis pv. begoniae]MBO9773438.1 NHLP-related RiPP peptide [Xanthomonas axonopodis pv. begoniae]MCC8469291.1 NHLP-related RiPP peptide [Xanthomonas phaseoli]PPT36373.1 putative modified peptide [Xanthomonas axonopodis pv. begoniae]
MPTLKLDPSVANNLVQRLSQDDAFRDLFVNDPVAALEQAGHTAENSDTLKQFIDECCTSIKLADKQTIAEARDEINAMLTSGTSQTVPMLEAGFGGSRTLK